jgi:KamA family protein
MEYKAFQLHNYKTIPQISSLSNEQIEAIEIVGSVLPFKSNNYVVDNLIDWTKVPDDPVFTMTFPQKEMLLPAEYARIKALVESGADKAEIKKVADEIRLELNPHPAGQIEHNVPVLGEERLYGMQHKYKETALFFPSQGQTCHAYCTFCFRWPQFVGMEEFKFTSRETELLVNYIVAHPEITDVLFTGGDPLVMKTRLLSDYIEPLLDASLPNIRNIRIGTRALTYWPYRFTADDDADDLLELFGKVRKAGKHLAFMAQFNHPVELEPEPVREAIGRIQETGAVIRTQTPLLRNINDSPEALAEMWRRQVALDCVPYYLFVVRNTGAQHYFSVPLIRAWQIFKEAYQSVSGICRTARGPSMSCMPGKMQILGVAEVKGEKVIVLRMIQGRNPDWAARPFFAEYDEEAIWYTELKPAFGEEKFFFQDELAGMLQPGEDESEYE